MINWTNTQRYVTDLHDVKDIENYREAFTDQTQVWHLHHRREISEQKSRKQLIAENLYFGRPASELLFLTKSEHTALHNNGRQFSAETRKKMSAIHKGQSAWNKGKPMSTEARQKLSDAIKGKHWFTNGLQDKQCYECPPGFWRGRTN